MVAEPVAVRVLGAVGDPVAVRVRVVRIEPEQELPMVGEPVGVRVDPDDIDRDVQVAPSRTRRIGALDAHAPEVERAEPERVVGDLEYLDQIGAFRDGPVGGSAAGARADLDEDFGLPFDAVGRTGNHRHRRGPKDRDRVAAPTVHGTQEVIAERTDVRRQVDLDAPAVQDAVEVRRDDLRADPDPPSAAEPRLGAHGEGAELIDALMAGDDRDVDGRDAMAAVHVALEDADARA